MITRLLVACAISSVVVGALSLRGTSAATSQAITSQSVRDSATPQRKLESPVDLQMLALERHAKVNMILYSGRLGDVGAAAAPVIALSVGAGTR